MMNDDDAMENEVRSRITHIGAVQSPPFWWAKVPLTVCITLVSYTSLIFVSSRKMHNQATIGTHCSV